LALQRRRERTTAAIWVVTFAAAGSLWVTLYWIFQAKSFAPVLLPPDNRSAPGRRL
jgi:hypothetical protein